MECPKCNGKAYSKGSAKGVTRWYCINPECGHKFKTAADHIVEPKQKIGMTLKEFRSKHDVEFIVKKTLSGLSRELIYEKSDIVKLSGLSPSYPGLGTTLDTFKEYQGRAGGRTYYSHPDTIHELKETAKMI